MNGDDRMPPLPAGELTGAQDEALREWTSVRGGPLLGPFVPALRSPEFMTRLQRLGEYLRFRSPLEPRLFELAILLTAREWTQQFEWHIHAPLAVERGLERSVIDAIADGRRPAAMADDEAVVHDFITELQRAKSVSDATYAAAVATVGEAGVIDLIGTVGYYALLAMIMNVARTPLPDQAPRPLGPFPAA